MSTMHRRFFKNWILCVLTLVVLGAVLTVVHLGMSQRHRPAARSVSGAPPQETRALPDPVAEAELPQVETLGASTPKESSSVSDRADVVAPVSPTSVSAPAEDSAVVSTVSGQTIAPPLARAVKAASAGVGSFGNSEIPTVNPPLAFTVDPKNLTPEQQTALARIQDHFLKAIGDADQNPADPAYGERWKTAQEIADQAYKAMFGWTAFSQMQLERARNSYTEIQVP